MFQRLTATGLSLACLIDRATSLLGRSVAWLTLLMVLLTCAVVLLRYGFDIAPRPGLCSAMPMYASTFSSATCSSAAKRWST